MAVRDNVVADQADAAELEPSTIVGRANMGQDGTLSGARNIAANVRHGTGDYEIVFKQPSLRRCTFNATSAGVGFVSVKIGPTANSLKVETRNHYGVLTDASFYLMAVCWLGFGKTCPGLDPGQGQVKESRS